MYRSGNSGVMNDVGGAVERSAKGGKPAFTVGRDTACDNQGNTALGTLFKIAGELTIIKKPIFEPCVHRPHDHAVF